MGKEVLVICPDEKLSELDFLCCFDKFKRIDYSKFNFESYDLFIILDSASPEVVTGEKDIPLPALTKIVIDHHKTNTSFGDINLIDAERSSATELLYLLFKDWKVKITKELATALMTGILGDTGAFEYHNTTARTLHVAADLMEVGADKDEILLKTSSLFTRMVEGTKFGIVMLEEKPGFLRASFRARSKFDVSKIALALGGGGHAGAAGATVELPFEKAVNKVIKTAEEFI
jgi:phosphoesterase RecJ-like protein